MAIVMLGASPARRLPMHHLLTATLASREDDALRAMFTARKDVFVDLLQWDVPVVDGRFEIDQFDDEFARYLILLDRAGRHLGSARLLATERPHILGSLFPELSDGPVPQDETTLEITRFCIDRSLRAATRRAVRDQLVTALVIHARDAGIARYTAVADIRWLQQILSFGWRCRPLGLPVADSSGTIGAIEIEIDADTPALLERAGIWSAAFDMEVIGRRAVGGRG
jgi:N-acyl-L-homoserine lactone synthetase